MRRRRPLATMCLGIQVVLAGCATPPSRNVDTPSRRPEKATTGLAAEIPAELHQAIRARDEAVAKKNASTWDRMTMSDFIAVRPEGKLMNKAERLAQLKVGKAEARPMPKQEHLIRYGDTVLRQLQDTKGTLWIDVWVKDGQAWRVASSQGTPPAK